MKTENQLPPFHIAAVTGMSELYNFILFKIGNESLKERIEVKINILEGNGEDVVPRFNAHRCTALH